VATRRRERHADSLVRARPLPGDPFDALVHHTPPLPSTVVRQSLGPRPSRNTA
jgi:hypothetical protein